MKSCFGKLGLWRRRECLLPTWRGWLLLLVTAGLVGVILIRCAQPFLAVTDSIPGGALIVEGWESDEALQEVIKEVQAHRYEKVYVTGGPLEVGTYLSAYQSFAELGSATLLRMGLSPDLLQPVPAPAVQQDRTYASAVALQAYLQKNGLHHPSYNVMSVGAHARRSRLMFQKALGEDQKVGIVAIGADNERVRHWWRSSEGFRTVTGEVIAYGYVCLIFRP